jgi:hypothetical protein
MRKSGRLANEVDICLERNDAALIAHVEQLLDGNPAVVAVVDGALVDVHADEAIGERGVQVAGELHGVLERCFAVVERVLDAVAQGVGGDELDLRTERAADGVAAKREGKAGLLVPPYAEVDDLLEAVLGVGELALVDEEASVATTAGMILSKSTTTVSTSGAKSLSVR